MIARCIMQSTHLLNNVLFLALASYSAGFIPVQAIISLLHLLWLQLPLPRVSCCHVEKQKHAKTPARTDFLAYSKTHLFTVVHLRQ
jgi:hypothetical protein